MSNYSLDQIKSKLSLIKNLKVQSERVGTDGYRTDSVIEGFKGYTISSYSRSRQISKGSDDQKNGAIWRTEIVLSI